MLSSSPSSVTRASTKRSNVAAFTKRTRTVSHWKKKIVKIQIANSSLYTHLQMGYFIVAVILRNKSVKWMILRFFKLEKIHAYGVGNAGSWPMISHLLQVNCVNGFFISLLTPKSPCGLLVEMFFLARKGNRMENKKIRRRVLWHNVKLNLNGHKIVPNF